MNNYHMTTKVLSRSRMWITVLVLVLAILSSLTASCKSEPPPAPAPTPPSQIPLKPIPETAPTRVPTPASTPSTPSFKLQTGSTISLGELETAVGEVGSMEITITGLTNGLSGYDLQISLSDRAVAEIIDIELPDFGLPDVNEISSSEVAIRAVDLKDIVPSGKAQALLATLKFQGIGLGTSNIYIVVNAMDDDDGNPMEPSVEIGIIKVVSAPSPTPSPAPAPAPPVVPQLVFPPDRSVFDYYPRTTTLKWNASYGSKPISYILEIQFTSSGSFNDFGLWAEGQYSRLYPGRLDFPPILVEQTEFTFDFVGAQPGRWRIKARNDCGESDWSEWRYFRYTQ